MKEQDQAFVRRFKALCDAAGRAHDRGCHTKIILETAGGSYNGAWKLKVVNGDSGNHPLFESEGTTYDQAVEKLCEKFDQHIRGEEEKIRRKLDDLARSIKIARSADGYGLE